MTEERTENKTFRCLSAIAIFMIVNGHLGANVFTLKGLFPYYSFHVALFVFISGYFCREKTEEGLLSLVKRRFLKLIVPLYLYTFVYVFIYYLLKKLGIDWGISLGIKDLLIGPVLGSQKFAFTYPMWFVPALFFCEIVMALPYWIFNESRLRDVIIGAVTLILNILVVALCKKGFRFGTSDVIVKAAFFAFFYHAGLCYRKYFEERIKIDRLLLFVIIAAVRLFLAMLNGDVGRYVIANDIFTECRFSFMPVLISIAGIAFWLNITKIIAPVLSNSRFIMEAGRNTYAIMADHIFMGKMILLFMEAVKYVSSCRLFSSLDLDLLLYERDYFYSPVHQSSVFLISLLAIWMSMLAVSLRRKLFIRIIRKR